MQTISFPLTTLIAFFALCVLALSSPTLASPSDVSGAADPTVHSYQKRRIPPAGIATLSVGLPISVIPVGGALIFIGVQQMRKKSRGGDDDVQQEQENKLEETEQTGERIETA